MQEDLGPGTWDVGGGREDGRKWENGRGTDGRDVKEWLRDETGRTVTVLTDIRIKS